MKKTGRMFIRTENNIKRCRYGNYENYENSNIEKRTYMFTARLMYNRAFTTVNIFTLTKQFLIHTQQQ